MNALTELIFLREEVPQEEVDKALEIARRYIKLLEES